ncbi:hypothetical protein [Archangium violaceum]|uniref:hypothetical protein n=1 Tax=Archangium violaceum TaxID=83451 RepID=UPI0037BE3AC1
MDDLDWEAFLLEEQSECTREFLFGDDPPDGCSIGGYKLALRLELTDEELEFLGF